MTSVTAPGASIVATAGVAIPSTRTAAVHLVTSPALGGRATIRATANSGQLMIAANSIVNSDISTSNEAVIGCSITGLSWTVSSGNTITVSRVVSDPANNIVQLTGTGAWNQALGWRGDGEWPTANIVITFTTGAVGVVFVDVAKRYQLAGAEA